MIKKMTRACLLFSLVTLNSCVTVNVNFPESAVQKATDDYVRELYRVKRKTTPTPAQSSSADQSFNFSVSDLLISTANADDIIIQSDKTKTILERQATRVDDVIEYKRKGILGETKDGKIILKDSSEVKKIMQKKIESLVESENKDRDLLYQEVLNINHFPPTRLKSIAASFARSFQAESPSGSWVETDSGQWTKKP